MRPISGLYNSNQTPAEITRHPDEKNANDKLIPTVGRLAGRASKYLHDGSEINTHASTETLLRAPYKQIRIIEQYYLCVSQQ